MATVRVECLAQVVKGKVLETDDGAGGGQAKTVILEGGNKEAHNSAQGHGETRREEDKGEKGESSMLIKRERSSVPVPFVQAVMDVHISNQFVPPQFKMYDGTTNPEAHVKFFTNAVKHSLYPSKERR